MKKTAVIRKCKESDKKSSTDIWCLYNHTGEKLLGRHPSKESAERQMRAVEMHKHGCSLSHLNKIVTYLELFKDG